MTEASFHQNKATYAISFGQLELKVVKTLKTISSQSQDSFHKASSLLMNLHFFLKNLGLKNFKAVSNWISLKFSVLFRNNANFKDW